MRSIWVLATVLVLVSGPASAGETLPQFEARITAELSAIDADAARLFTDANEARDRGDHAAAEQLYLEVVQRAPSFHHARRRLGTVRLALGRHDEGVADLRAALAQSEDAEGMAALALALMSGESEANLAEASALVKRALARWPESAVVQQVRASLALRRGDVLALRAAAARLRRLDPDGLATHVFEYFAALTENDPDAALAHLERARGAGLAEQDYLMMRAKIEPPRAAHVDLFGWAWRGAAGWLGTLVLLLVAGWILSAIALRAAARPPEEQTPGSGRLLRTIYRVVLWVSCAYYYVSIPLLILAIVALGGAAIYLFFAIGQIPVKLVVLIGALVLVTLGAILRSLFIRGQDGDPGLALDLGRHPKLRELLDEVAARIGTRAVTHVYMTPDTDVAVLERGGLSRQLRGTPERCLILGAGVLDGMTVRQLRSILGHEYGHFHNEDTAGGGFAIAVRRSLLTMALRLAQHGAASWYNPAWWFVRGFYAVFLRISQGASRLQEVLADRAAARAFGSRAFEDGLRHVVSRSIAFDLHTRTAIQEVIDSRRPLANLYTYVPSQEIDRSEVEQATREQLERKPSPYDSHPAPGQRIDWVHKLHAPDAELPCGDDPAWTLFSDREAVERQMTGVLRDDIQERFGVLVPAERAA